MDWAGDQGSREPLPHGGVTCVQQQKEGGGLVLSGTDKGSLADTVGCC